MNFTADNAAYTVLDKAFSGFCGTIYTPDVKSFDAGALSGFKGSLVVDGMPTNGKFVKNGVVRFYDCGSPITLSGGEVIDAASNEGFTPPLLDLRGISSAVTINDKADVAGGPIASMAIIDSDKADFAKDLADTGTMIETIGAGGDIDNDGTVSIADVTSLVYQLLHPTPPSITGTATYLAGGFENEVTWLQMWENGPKFAEKNVGSSAPASHGGYYAWGGTSNHYSYASGSADLSGSNDNATYSWGENWRLPTKTEFEGLLANCDLTLDRNYEGTGVRVLKFTGRGRYAENVLILPCSGYAPDLGVEHYVNQAAYYLTSTANGQDASYYFNYWDADENGVTSGQRSDMVAVRAVLK